MTALMSMLHRKWLVSIQDPTGIPFSGKTVIITGANSGLGLEAGKKFIKLGAKRIILAVRDTTKGEQAKATLQSINVEILVWQLNLSSYSSIESFVKQIKDLDRIDIVVLNAGIQNARYKKSDYGYEETIQINTLSTALLATLILPQLIEKSTKIGIPATLEVINTSMYLDEKLSKSKGSSLLDQYNDAKSFNPFRQYRTSKLFLFHYIDSLAQCTPSKQVTIISLCPGSVKTDLGRDYDFFGVGVAKWIFQSLFQISTEIGARTYINAILAGESAHGKFWNKDHLEQFKPQTKEIDGVKVNDIIWKEVRTSIEKEIALPVQH